LQIGSALHFDWQIMPTSPKNPSMSLRRTGYQVSATGLSPPSHVCRVINKADCGSVLAGLGGCAIYPYRKLRLVVGKGHALFWSAKQATSACCAITHAVAPCSPSPETPEKSNLRQS
jgi:hypothetical protein